MKVAQFHKFVASISHKQEDQPKGIKPNVDILWDLPHEKNKSFSLSQLLLPKLVS